MSPTMAEAVHGAQQMVHVAEQALSARVGWVVRSRRGVGRTVCTRMHLVRVGALRSRKRGKALAAWIAEIGASLQGGGRELDEVGNRGGGSGKMGSCEAGNKRDA